MSSIEPPAKDQEPGGLVPAFAPSSPADSQSSLSDISATSTQLDLAHWRGWCEIESEPAFFNAILKDWGVKGVKVREIYSLDDEILAFLPRPIYGLIFLFRWIDDGLPEEEHICPSETIKNACASFALLNIVNNVPGIDIGSHLQNFKNATKHLSPVGRGNAMDESDLLRETHNSLARKMDMLLSDVQWKIDAESAKKKSALVDDDELESEAGYHFIAFVPIEGKIWKLDGLENQPRDLGNCKGNDWLGQIKPDIEARMAAYEGDEIEFAILGLVRDPLLTLVPSLGEATKSISATSKRLDEIKPDWRNFITETAAEAGQENDPVEPDLSCGLDQMSLDAVSLPPEVNEKLQSSSAPELMDYHQERVTARGSIRASILEELESNEEDARKTASRRYDYGAGVQTWLDILANGDFFKSVAEHAEENSLDKHEKAPKGMKAPTQKRTAAKKKTSRKRKMPDDGRSDGKNARFKGDHHSVQDDQIDVEEQKVKV